MPLQPAENVPTEMWLQIFENIDTPADLNSVIRTCRNFYSYAIRSLHRNIIWRTPRELANNLPTYTAFPVTATDVRSLEIHISTLPDSFDARFVGLNGAEYYGPTRPSRSTLNSAYYRSLKKTLSYYKLEIKPYAATALYNAMIDQVHNFTNVSSLTFRNLLFSDQLFPVIHALPALRKLHIELCLFPSRNNGQPADHSTLSITELTLLNLRRRVHPLNNNPIFPDADYGPHHPHPVIYEDADANFVEEIFPVLHLALAHNLHTLRIDCTADVLHRVFTTYNPATQQTSYHLPATLRRLYCIKKRHLPFEHQPPCPGEQTFPGRALYDALQHNVGLEAISICTPLPRNTTLPTTILPNLRFVEADSDVLALIVPTRPIEAVSLLWSESSVVSTLDILDVIARNHPDLQMLAVECGVWDDEVLHAVCLLFPQLKRLKITWIGGGPTEDTIVSLGPQFISKLEHLHTLQIFHTPNHLVPPTLPAANDLWDIEDHDIRITFPVPKPSPYFDPNNPAHQNQSDTFSPPHPKTLFDDTFDGIEEELRDLLVPWNRYCENLRVVELCEGWRMRKEWKGGKWRMEKVREVYVEDFDF